MTGHPFAAEPPMGAPLPPEARAVSGLRQLERQLAGEWSPPPIYFMTGLLVQAAAAGQATFTVPVTEWWEAEGAIDWASLSVFAVDAPLGVAVLTSLGAGHATPTAELSVTYVKYPARADCLRASARLVVADGDTGVSQAEVRTDADELIALATTRVFDVAIPSPLVAPEHGVAESRNRPTARAGERMPIYQRTPPASGGAPIDGLLGISADHREDRLSFSVQVSGWVASPAGTTYGGFLAAAAQRAAVLASRPLGGGPGGRPLDLKVNFFRPVPPRPLVLVGVARMVRSGRRAGLAEVSLADAAGAPVVHAVSTLRLPGN